MSRKPAPSQTVQLQNPVADHYETFIVGNAVAWQVRAMVELEAVMEPALYAELKAEFEKYRPGMAFAKSVLFHDYVAPFAKRYVVQENSAKGQHLVICGAGPSLRETAEEWCPQGDQVWGCNSALMWLLDHGHKVTHGFTVDQTPHMCAEWASAPDVDYLLATSVHPHLTSLLCSKGHSIQWFHNFLGIRKPHVQWPDACGVMGTLPYEDWLYNLLFPQTTRSGSGLNATTRAIDVATYMGFEKITVLGADCCIRTDRPPPKRMATGSPRHLRWLREHTTMHADGGHALASEASALTLQAVIDGRFWLTKVDMAITAQWLVRMARASNGRIQVKGDGLATALMDKSDAFLKRMPNFVLSDGSTMEIDV